MKHNNALTRLIALLLVSLTVFTGTVMALGAGSSGDPLVTLSYLNEKFMPQVLTEVDRKILARNEEVSALLSAQIRSDAAEFEQEFGSGSGGEGASSGTAESFLVVTLANGQTLYGDVGCEVMLRTGSAVCVADSAPGLINETTAGTLYGGDALAKNHLCMMTVSERGVRATAADTKLLVRGSYRVQ